MRTTRSHSFNLAFLLLLLLTLGSAPWAHAATNIALPLYEPFAYPGNGIKLGNDQPNGSDIWGNTRNMPNLTNTGSLTYPGLPASVGNRVTVIGGTANCDNNGPRPNISPSVSSGSLYFSFLLRVRSTLGVAGIPDPGRCVFNLTSGGGDARVLGVALADDGLGNTKIGVVKWPKSYAVGHSGSAFFASPISTDDTTTYFVIAKYEIKTAGSEDDECTLWLNPSSAYFGGVTEDPGNKVLVNTGIDGGGIGMSRLYIQQGYDAEIDELRIGKNWVDVAPSSCGAVNVISPPVGVASGVGGYATFTVTASGTDPTYQWRRDGTNLVNGGNILGAASPTLTIDPITASDAVPEASGYAVVVQNTCGGGSSQTSAPVALTLITGANLAWKGDGAANEWDVGITANWNNNTVAFTNGDNVTFDDSSINTTVSVVSNPQPVRVFVNATNDYALNGTIAGPAFLIKTNTGKLSFTSVAANTYTGKTTLKQGTLAIIQETGLGGNPGLFKADQLTLDGGTLQAEYSLTIDDLNRGTTLGPSGGRIEVNPGVTLSMKSPIAGPPGADLVQIGGGILKMESVNTYAGNTIISNGVMYLNNSSGFPFGNGAGTLILAGGNLQVESRGDPNLDIRNPVTLAVDSELTTIQTSKTTVDFRLHNDTSCLSGNARLTIRDDSGMPGHLFYIRLYGSNLTFNGPVVLDPGAGGGTVQFACNNQGGTHVFNGVISGPGILMRRADSSPGGDTVLNNLNTYSVGTTLLQGGLGFGINSTGPANAPTAGPIGTGPLSGGGSTTKVFASGGSRNVGNPVFITSSTFAIGGANDLTLSGDIDLGGLPRTLRVDNTGMSILSGNVGNGSLTKEGNGTLLLNGSVSVSDITVNAGTLGGTGTLVSLLTVNTNGTLSPGASIGTLTVSNDVVLAGNTLIEVNKAAGARDLITGVNTLTCGGTLTVTNLSGTLTTNDTFKIFSATAPIGDFASIVGTPGPGLQWSFNPASGVLSVVGGGAASNPTNISYTVTGGMLNLTWPASHLGWIAASNSVDVNSKAFWFDIAGSASATSLNVPIEVLKTNVFFRLHSP